MRVLYLYNGKRKGLIEKVKSGENHGDGFWGMLRLSHYNIVAEYVELEDYFSEQISTFFRKHINIYFIHTLFFWKIFFYDIVFTSSGFGTQLIYSILPFRKPLWVMHDFSIISLLGNGKTLKQKIFHFLVMRCGGVVTLSEYEKEEIEKRFPHLRGKVAFIPFGVDTDFFKPDISIKEEDFILAVGFDPDRDWKTLIEAGKELGTKIVIATRHERVAHLLPLPKNVVVSQFQLKDLVKEYNKAKLVIVPLDTSKGINDAMGCSTLFEAMAMQKTVIITETKTTASYVTHNQNAVLVAEGQPHVLRSEITRLLSEPETRKRIGLNARKYVIEHLDAEEKAKELANYFKKLLNTK